MFITKKTGNIPPGKEMFKKHCAVCHQINGEGNKVGPDLTGMAVHPKAELLIHILDPNRSVEGNYHLYKVTTLTGKNFEGLLASETKTSVELIDAQAKKQVILREDIDQLIATTKSLMPEGFEKQMKPEEFTDLLEFLTQKGKYVPIPLDKAATVVSTEGCSMMRPIWAKAWSFSTGSRRPCGCTLPVGRSSEQPVSQRYFVAQYQWQDSANDAEECDVALQYCRRRPFTFSVG